ncbi:MAG: hypothetical protein K0R50_3337 [Eubacterium sp.]|nr:hypothetical protein [Eubacterium sp.]
MIVIAGIDVKVKLKANVTVEEFWRATYSSDTNLGLRLIPNFENMKKTHLKGKLYKFGSLEVAIPIAYFNRENESVDDDIIEYSYIKESKEIWDIDE